MYLRVHTFTNTLSLTYFPSLASQVFHSTDAMNPILGYYILFKKLQYILKLKDHGKDAFISNILMKINRYLVFTLTALEADS